MRESRKLNQIKWSVPILRGTKFIITLDTFSNKKNNLMNIDKNNSFIPYHRKHSLSLKLSYAIRVILKYIMVFVKLLMIYYRFHISRSFYNIIFFINTKISNIHCFYIFIFFLFSLFVLFFKNFFIYINHWNFNIFSKLIFNFIFYFIYNFYLFNNVLIKNINIFMF